MAGYFSKSIDAAREWHNIAILPAGNLTGNQHKYGITRDTHISVMEEELDFDIMHGVQQVATKFSTFPTRNQEPLKC